MNHSKMLHLLYLKSGVYSMKSHKIDTPALLLDLDAMERNLTKMALFFGNGPTRLRPHYKNHRSPALARRQLDAGAIGLTCATLSEAEAFVSNEFSDILSPANLPEVAKLHVSLNWHGSPT